MMSPGKTENRDRIADLSHVRARMRMHAATTNEKDDVGTRNVVTN
jgi:hypothetical protein